MPSRMPDSRCPSHIQEIAQTRAPRQFRNREPRNLLFRDTPPFGVRIIRPIYSAGGGSKCITGDYCCFSKVISEYSRNVDVMIQYLGAICASYGQHAVFRTCTRARRARTYKRRENASRGNNIYFQWMLVGAAKRNNIEIS